MSYKQSTKVSTENFIVYVGELKNALNKCVDDIITNFKAGLQARLGVYTEEIIDAHCSEYKHSQTEASQDHRRRKRKRTGTFWRHTPKDKQRIAIERATKGHPLTKIAKDMDISYLSMLAAMKKMPNFKRLTFVKITADDQTKMADLYLDGYPITKIAHQLETTAGTVSKHLKNLGYMAQKGVKGVRDHEV